jgi:hypothetical protein
MRRTLGDSRRGANSPGPLYANRNGPTVGADNRLRGLAMPTRQKRLGSSYSARSGSALILHNLR